MEQHRKRLAADGHKIALSYPDIYEIGMSNMAIPILYEILNNQPDVLAEGFAPVDMAAAIKAGIPLQSLESGHPLNEFDIVDSLSATNSHIPTS